MPTTLVDFWDWLVLGCSASEARSHDGWLESFLKHPPTILGTLDLPRLFLWLQEGFAATENKATTDLPEFPSLTHIKNIKIPDFIEPSIEISTTRVLPCRLLNFQSLVSILDPFRVFCGHLRNFYDSKYEAKQWFSVHRTSPDQSRTSPDSKSLRIPHRFSQSSSSESKKSLHSAFWTCSEGLNPGGILDWVKIRVCRFSQNLLGRVIRRIWSLLRRIELVLTSSSESKKSLHSEFWTCSEGLNPGGIFDWVKIRVCRPSQSILARSIKLSSALEILPFEMNLRFLACWTP